MALTVLYVALTVLYETAMALTVLYETAMLLSKHGSRYEAIALDDDRSPRHRF